MLKRCFNPYIIGAGIVVFLAVSYVGYRTYQRHVEFKAFMSKAQVFNRPIEGHHVHSSKEHTHHGEGPDKIGIQSNLPKAAQVESMHEQDHHLAPSGEYVYEINGAPLYSNLPLSQEQIELREWIQTGKMTPAVEEQFRDREALKSDNVVQHVVAPDGKLHQVIVPRYSQYEEGDAILQSELDPPMLLEEFQNPKQGRGKLIIEGVEYPMPDEFHTIADPYEREAYLNKFAWSIKNGVSMAEVEKKVAKGELDFSLSEDAKRHVDEHEAMMERYKMLAFIPPPLSDKSPVKVSFLPNEGEDALPGWMRKGEGNRPSGSNEASGGGTYSETDTVSEGSIPFDTDTAPVRSDVPLSSSSLPGMAKSPPSPQNVADLEKQLTPAGIEAELSEEVSADRFDKVQQLIDKYGSEEGLRRFREMDPEAARQFEREQHKPKMNTEP